MKILYTTGDALWIAENGTAVPLPCRRVQQYQDTIRSIHEGKLWKTTGRGAHFMGTDEPEEMEPVEAQFCGLAPYGDEFLYTLRLDASGGLYRRELTEQPVLDGHIVSGNDVRLGAIAVCGDDVAACVQYPNGSAHIGLYHLPQSICNEITEGDSAENSPSWSPDGQRLYFSTCGIARGSGLLYSPSSIAVYYPGSGRMDIVLENEKYDYLSPQCGEDGSLYVIRQPYAPADGSSASIGQILLDVLLFPVRIVQAIGGWLNIFSMMYGGHALRSGGARSDVKSKQKSEKDLFFEGNLIHAQKNLKENTRSGEKYPGILPRSRVLLRQASDGSEEILAKGVLDYCLTPEGIVYSNGAHILLRRPDGTAECLAKARLAAHLVAFSDPTQPVSAK